ncbi:MAG: C40 family peptidase [Kineosporiaceae bacterium]
MAEHVTSLGRGGVVIAMSSGLVATMASPAGAAPAPVVETATLPSVGVDSSSVPLSLRSGAAVTAPAGAVVDFGDEGGVAVTKAAAKVSRKVETTRHVERAARATQRVAPTRQADDDADRVVTKRKVTRTATGSVRGSAVLGIAARYVGIAYRHGGDDPRGFDCSGYVDYVYNQLGVSLPRTADGIMDASRRISRSEAVAGDLVFFVNGGRATHVGIYAGDGMMYDSPRTGKRISLRAVYSSRVVFGRVLG